MANNQEDRASKKPPDEASNLPKKLNPSPSTSTDSLSSDAIRRAELNAARIDLKNECPCNLNRSGKYPCRPSLRSDVRYCAKCKKLTPKNRIEGSLSKSQLMKPSTEKCEGEDKEPPDDFLRPKSLFRDLELEYIPVDYSPPPPPPPTLEKPKCHTCKYRRSLENWRPLEGKLYCPRCCSMEVPILRIKTKKSGSTMYETFSSRCFTHCWPLCFMPFLFLPPSENYLHCAECFAYLGMYDEQKKCVVPNPDYIENDGCFVLKPSKRRGRERAKLDVWKEYSFH